MAANGFQLVEGDEEEKYWQKVFDLQQQKKRKQQDGGASEGAKRPKK